MLRWRLASAAVIIAVLIALVVIDFQLIGTRTPGVWLAPVLVLISGMGAWEVIALLRAGGYYPRPILTTILTALVSLSFCGWIAAELWPKFVARFGEQTYEAPLLMVTLAAMILLTAEIARFSPDSKGVLHAALGLFVVVYIGALFGFLALLRGFHSNQWGLAAVVSTLTITKFADAGAYFVGRTLGRHKMTPKLSPGKTIEGAIGGVVAACLMSWIFFHWIAAPWIGARPAPPMLNCFAYGAILAVVGMLGDLAESMLKREMRSKDSSNWLPGLGGVMDIIDSVLFAAPAAYLCFVFRLIGP